MGNDHHRPAAGDPQQVGVHQCFGFRIERAGRLIKDQNARIGNQRSGNGEPLALYRARFQPSQFLQVPYVMLGLNVVVADSDDEARRLFTSLQQAFVNLRTGRPGPLPPPVTGWSPPDIRLSMMLDQALACALVGAPAAVSAGLDAFIATHKPDELMVTAQIYDHAARLKSYEILSKL